jgi:cytochrome P450
MRTNTPITYMVPRSPQKDAVLTGQNGKKYFFPAGSSIILNITSIHYNEHYWPDATRFDPERFMSKSESQEKEKEKEIDTSMWLPFAIGARQCPAR